MLVGGGGQGCDNIRAVVIVELVDKAQGSNSSANLQAWQIGSVSDDVGGSTLDGRKPSQGSCVSGEDGPQRRSCTGERESALICCLGAHQT